MTADDVVEVMAKILSQRTSLSMTAARDITRDMIRAVTERGGLVAGKMPGDVVFPDDASEDTGPYARGHNAALAAVRANAVKVEP